MPPLKLTPQFLWLSPAPPPRSEGRLPAGRRMGVSRDLGSIPPRTLMETLLQGATSHLCALIFPSVNEEEVGPDSKKLILITTCPILC